MEFCVKFENYRCLRETSLRLTPLTVLVGENASGKSSILRSLDPAQELSERDVWQMRHERGVAVVLKLDGQRTLTRTWDPRSRRPTLSDTRAQQPSVRVQSLHLDLAELRPERQFQAEHRLSKTGANIGNVFGTLSRPKQQEVVQQLARLVPVIGDIHHAPSRAGHVRLIFQDAWNHDAWYEPSEVSDGTFLTLAYLLLQHQQDFPSIVTIDEPERGLHPYLIEQVVRLLRRLAHGEFGRSIHIVLATHSPALVEFVQPEELRFLNREQDGSVTIHELPTASKDWQVVLKEYTGSLGGVWMSGTIGGVPSARP